MSSERALFRADCEQRSPSRCAMVAESEYAGRAEGGIRTGIEPMSNASLVDLGPDA